MLIDRFERTIDYLRVSLTDRCNFRCVYCMPEEGFPCTPKEEHLSTSEFVRIIRIAADQGIRKVRFTGGEPLLRKDLCELVSAAKDAGIRDLSLTTNGHLLGRLAPELKAAGLDRVNVSLDTLRSERFSEIARRGEFGLVMDGIRESLRVGLSPVKLNVVVLKGMNDDEGPEFAEWTKREPVHVRFIELMPMRWNLDEGPSLDAFAPHGGEGLLQLRQAPGGMLSDSDLRRRFVSGDTIRRAIEGAHGPLVEAAIPTNGPARTFKIPGALGTIGFISQISDDLCSGCNRLRLTHDGFLRPCLMSDGELDLRTRLRSGATDHEIAELFAHVVAHKPERHFLSEGQRVGGRGMSQIGG